MLLTEGEGACRGEEVRSGLLWARSVSGEGDRAKGRTLLDGEGDRARGRYWRPLLDRAGPPGLEKMVRAGESRSSKSRARSVASATVAADERQGTSLGPIVLLHRARGPLGQKISGLLANGTQRGPEESFV